MPIIQTTKALRPREPNDHYPTPLPLCRAALKLLPRNLNQARMNPFIVDPGAGTGVWGTAAKELWPDAEISGCDIRDLPQPPAYDQWIPNWNFLTQAVGGGADLVMGNPPYSLAEDFVRKAHRFVWEDRFIVFLLRLAFLESQTRGRGLWKEFPPLSVHVLVSRPSFITEGPKKGNTDATAYAIYVWRSGWHGSTELKWLDWEPEPEPTMVTLPMFAEERS